MSFSTSSQSPSASPLRRWLLGLAVAAGAWFLAYSQLTTFADAVVLALGLSRDTGLGEAVHFFFVYDTPKAALLLAGVVFIVGVVQTFAPRAHPRCFPGGAPGWAMGWPRCWASSPPSARARPCPCSSAFSRLACRWG